MLIESDSGERLRIRIAVEQFKFKRITNTDVYR